MSKKNEIKIWEKYNNLTILYEDDNRWKERYIFCKCNCWNIKSIRLNSVLSWRTKTCWCLQKEKSKIILSRYNDLNKSKARKHWLSNSRMYHIYQGIKQRCNNIKNKKYDNYWWRWIKCLWNTFEDFKSDMYESYLNHCKEFWEKQTTIDRIDSNWNYCKDNCRWADYLIQWRNKRKSLFVEYNWEIIHLKELCNNLSVNYDLVKSRYKRWKSIYNSINLKKWKYKD